MRKSKVLIVEDESIPAMDLKFGLVENGYDVVAIAMTGDDAVHKARTLLPDIILMDVHLRGGVDGITAAQQIKEFSDIPILYCTAHSDEATVQRATKTVPHGFLLKPYQFDEVRPTIEFALYKSRIERELQQSEERYRIIADGMNDVVFALDLDLRITYVTPSVRRTLGYTVDECLSMSMWDFLDEENREKVHTMYEAIFASWTPGTPAISLESELELLSKTRQKIYCEIRVALRVNKQGQAIEFVGVGRDITARKRADDLVRASEDRYRSIVEQCSDGFLLVNKAGTIVEWNKSSEVLFNLPREQAIGRQFVEFQIASLPPERRTDQRIRELQALNDKVLSGSGENIYRRTVEVEAVNTNGRRIHFLQTIFPVQTVDGLSIGSFNRDISERKHIELSLQESEERFRRMADTTPMLLWVAGPDRVATYFNRAWREFTGRTLEQEVNEGWIENVHADEQKLCRAHYLKSDVLTKPITVEYRLRRHDGVYRWILDHGVPRVLANGTVAGYIGSCVDITERKAIEEKLLDSERQYRTLIEGMSEAVMQVDNNDVILFVNQQLCDITGYTREELIGNTGLSILFDQADQQTIRNKNRRRLQKFSDTYEISLRKKSGERLWTRISGSPVLDVHGNVLGSIGVLTDVSMVKRAAEALRVSEERYRSIFERAPLGIFQSALDGTILQANPTVARMFGYDPIADAGLRGKVNANQLFVDPERRETFLPTVLMSDDFAATEIDYRKKDGSIFQGRLHLRAVRDAAGRPSMLEGFVEDITERQRLERAIRDHEAQLSEITDNMMELVVKVDQDLNFVYVSPSLERILGYQPHELLHANALEWVKPEERDPIVEELRSVLRAGTGSVQFQFRHKNGSYRWLEAMGKSIVNDAGQYTGAVIGCRDVTDRKITEEKLTVSLREKEILVREVHHRVKNNLSVAASLLAMQSRHAKVKEDVTLFEEARNRLIAMSRIHETLYKSANIAQIDFPTYVNDLVEGLRKSYGRPGIATQVEIDTADLTLDKAIPLGLIINELVTNSFKYAFQGKDAGTITISFSHAAEGYRLAVRDDGHGLPEGFDLDKNESLGLNLVSMLVAQVDGTLRASDSVGTTFEITLPGPRPE